MSVWHAVCPGPNLQHKHKQRTLIKKKKLDISAVSWISYSHAAARRIKASLCVNTREILLVLESSDFFKISRAPLGRMKTKRDARKKLCYTTVTLAKSVKTKNRAQVCMCAFWRNTKKHY